MSAGIVTTANATIAVNAESSSSSCLAISLLQAVAHIPGL
jgi:hypothetical protein